MRMELEFNLPEEYDDALLAFRGKDLWCVLFDVVLTLSIITIFFI